MQKIVAAVLASLLLCPVGSFAQDSKINDGGTIDRGPASKGMPGTLRESAIRHARLAATNDASQAPQNAGAPNQPSLGSDVGKGALWGAGIGAALGLVAGLVSDCPEGTGKCPGMLTLVTAMSGAMWGAMIGLIVHVARP